MWRGAPIEELVKVLERIYRIQDLIRGQVMEFNECRDVLRRVWRIIFDALFDGHAPEEAPSYGRTRGF